MLRSRLRMIYHQLPLPWRLPAGAREFRRLNERLQWAPLPEIRQYQLERMQALLRQAQENVPYYAGLFRQLGFSPEDLRSLEDLRLLPLLEKETVRHQPAQLTARDWKRWKPVTRVTGGSTGQKLAVLMSERAQHAHLADGYRHYHWAGYEQGQRAAMLVPGLNGLTDPQALSYLHRPRRMLYLNASLFNREKLGQLAGLMAEYQPRVLMAPPSHLHLLCGYLEEQGIGGIRPQVLLTTSETLYDFQREAIERYFGVRVWDFYGLSEHVASAAQCEAGRYHMSLEYTHMEVLRPDGQSALPGEEGEIVGTNFENYSMPLIRYRTGDMAVVGKDPCPCGRTLPTLERVSGRAQDMIVTPKGLVAFAGFGPSSGDVKTVKEFQIVQEAMDRFRIKVVAAPGYRPEEGRRLATLLERSLDFPVNVTVEEVRDIPRTERGKLRLVQCMDTRSAGGQGSAQR